jgi:iron complex outermembrane receptor protein
MTAIKALPRVCGVSCGAALLAVLVQRPALAALDTQLSNLRRMSIEELASVEISSVSKSPEPLAEAPSAVYVITPDAIRRSGAVTLPEALRLAPNLIVARKDSLNYAVSARGFNSVEASRKILAIIDGRSVYSFLHSGVFWDSQDIMLDDIQRIEVVSGPGGTLWGANAVNGVINIVSKSSRDTQGLFGKVSYGNLDRSFAARFGGQINEPLTYRVYIKGTRHGDTETPAGTSRRDALSGLQGGFRADWQGNEDLVTVQGDIYHGDSDQGGQVELGGGNVLARWSRPVGPGTLQAQVYYDRTQRDSPGVVDHTDTYDIDLQQNAVLGAHSVVVGGGYRVRTETFNNTLNAFNFATPRKTLGLGNVYFQDTLTLASSLKFIAGIKFEHNAFTGWEVMPNARIAWQVSPRNMVWAAVSRAVQTPSRIDRELEAPPLLLPAPDFESEQLLAYEVGYRAQPASNLSLSISVYYDIYHDVRATTITPVTVLPIQLRNDHYGHVYGVEAWANYNPIAWWRLEFGVNALHKALKTKPGKIVIAPDQSLGNDPDYQVFLRSSFAIARDVDLDIGARIIDALADPAVPSYIALDTRLAYRFSDQLELSLTGQNLLENRHPETGQPTDRGEIPRSFVVSARWSF